MYYLAKYIKGKGKKVGVYASASQWNSILGSKSACTEVATMASELWYPHYDKNPSFSDFASFGGWSKPAIKQYQGDITVCGVDSDLNYSPWMIGKEFIYLFEML